MFPHEAQATMAKFLFMLFAILILLVGKLKAFELSPFHYNSSLDYTNTSH